MVPKVPQPGSDLSIQDFLSFHQSHKHKIKLRKIKCEYCKQLFKSKQGNHNKNGQCKMYSKFIEYSSNTFQCKLCNKLINTRKDLVKLYKHIAKKHKKEMSKIETNELLEKQAKNLEGKINSELYKISKKKAVEKIWLDIEKKKESKSVDQVKSKKRKKCENCHIEFAESILANHLQYCKIDSKEAIKKKLNTTEVHVQCKTVHESKNHSNKDTLNLNNHKDSTRKSSENLDKIRPPQENYSKKSIKATVGLIKCEYCREKVEKNKTNKHNSECLKAAKKISDKNQCLICSSKFDKKLKAFKHVKLDHPEIFLGHEAININGLNSKIEVKKEPLIKTSKSFGIAPPDFMLIYFSYLQKIMILMFRSDYRGTVGVDFALKVLELPGNIRVRY